MSENQNNYGEQGSCEGFLELLPLYEGGELELDQADRLRGHLEACAACNAQWVIGKKAIAMRQEAWTLQAGETPDLWSGIQSQLRSEGLVGSKEALAEVPQGGALLRFPILRFAAAAAVLVGMLAVGDRFLGDSTSTPNGSLNSGNLVADGAQVEVPSPVQVHTNLAAEVAPAPGKLRLAGPDESSVLEEARPWGLEETSSGDLRRRTESMQVAGWR